MSSAVVESEVQILTMPSSKNTKGRTASTGSGTHRGGTGSTKKPSDMSKFDFASVDAALPANTGPPGTVPVTNGNGNSSSTNKNLSHVPCKFYRQGICQAGTSCPFSHNLGGNSAADKLPCKYFQKGNCKFGLKCALAHFLPDGTRINSKGLLNHVNRRSSNQNQNQHNYSNNTNTSFNGNGTFNGTPTVTSSDGGGSTNGGTGYFIGESTGISSSADSSFGFGSGSSPTSNYVSANTQTALSQPLGSSFGSPDSIFHPTTGLYQNPFSTSANGSISGSLNGSGTLSQTTLNNPSSQWARSYSANTAPITFNPSSSLHSSNIPFFQSPPPAQRGSFGGGSSKFSFAKPPVLSSSHNQLTSPSYYYDSSAIVDDDESSNGGESGIFEEDYVPASLSDIVLTPQELMRRDSRSQSGTLLVRPNLSSILDLKDDDFAGESHKPPNQSVMNEAFKKFKSDPHDDVFLME